MVLLEIKSKSNQHMDYIRTRPSTSINKGKGFYFLEIWYFPLISNSSEFTYHKTELVLASTLVGRKATYAQNSHS